MQKPMEHFVINRTLRSLLVSLAYFSVHVMSQFSVMMAVYVAALVIGVMNNGITSGAFGNDFAGSGMMYITMMISGGVALLVYTAVFAVRRVPFRERLDLRGIKLSQCLAVISLGIVLDLVIAVAMAYIPFPEYLLENYDAASAPLYDSITLLSVFTIAIVTPVIEEVVYRGLIYKTLKSGFPAAVAFILQAALFGVMHGDIIWGVAAFFMGLAFAAVYDKTKSLFAPIIMHASLNAFSLLMVFVYS